MMADHLTPAESTMIDAIVDPIRRERDAAPGLAAKYDSACDAVADQYDEIVRLRRKVESLEDQLSDARAETARESALVSEARHERDTARQEAREARREAARTETPVTENATDEEHPAPTRYQDKDGDVWERVDPFLYVLVGTDGDDTGGAIFARPLQYVRDTYGPLTLVADEAEGNDQ